MSLSRPEKFKWPIGFERLRIKSGRRCKLQTKSGMVDLSLCRNGKQNTINAAKSAESQEGRTLNDY
jgi:hypothetical protein